MPHRRENGKYLCSGCGRQVDFSELKCCDTCGYFFCPSCQERHRCRITEEGAVEIHVFDSYSQRKESVVDDLFEDIPTVEDVVFFDSKNKNSKTDASHTVERVFCSKCGDVIIKENAILCPRCGKYFCDDCIENHICNHDVVLRDREVVDDTDFGNISIGNLEQELMNIERAKEPDRYSQCSNCGNYFLKHEMINCQTCGFVLCPSCAGSHVCNPDDILKYRDELEQIRIEQESILRIEQEKLNIERSREPEKYSRCDNCGNYFFKHDMKRCTYCGAVLCPSCRESHSHSIIDNLFGGKGKRKTVFLHKNR